MDTITSDETRPAGSPTARPTTLNGCCDTGRQATCCAPADKSACCDPAETAQGSCGCAEERRTRR